MKDRYYIIHISEINELKELFISSPSGTLRGHDLSGICL